MTAVTGGVGRSDGTGLGGTVSFFGFFTILLLRWSPFAMKASVSIERDGWEQMVYAVDVMAGLLKKHGKRRVFIIGAGFNAPLGMPLTSDLLKQVHAVAASKPWVLEDGKPAPREMADWLVEVLDWYYPAGMDHHMWQLPWLWLEDDLEITIIGYSIRPDDYQSRAFIYPRLVRGSRCGALRVKVIDKADTQAARGEVRERFAGVSNCEFCFEGFSKEAVEFIARG
jgi:pimeloyl-ACP methyl ester carboxylesterase